MPVHWGDEMAVKNDIAIYIDGINRTSKLAMPVKFSALLDESLDEAVISLKHVKKDIFQPLTPVEIHVTNTVRLGNTTKSETKVYYFYVSGDTAQESPVGSGLYDHDIALVEVTKIAECIVVDTLTVTNDIGRVYADGAIQVQPQDESFNSVFG